MEELKKLLGEELFKQVTDKLGTRQLFMHEKDQKVVVDDGQLIPRSRLNEESAKVKDLQSQITTLNTEVEKLKPAAEGNEKLTAQIAQLQTDIKTKQTDFEQKEKLMTNSFAFKEGLFNAGVEDADSRELIAGKFTKEISEGKLDDKGKFLGFDEIIKPVKEHKTLGTLFTKTEIVGGDHSDGNLKKQGLYTRDEVKNMSQAEVDANYETVQKSMAAWQENGKND